MNKYSIIIIIIALIIIVSCAFFKSTQYREGLTNNDNIVLIGDSILNNSAYVPKNKSVADILKMKTENVFNYAKDGATLQDCYEQLDHIPEKLNTNNTYIFISIGGNDILNNRGKLNSTEIRKLFDSYLSLINDIRVKFSQAKINILNLYIPTNKAFQSYKESIDQWNGLIKDYSNKAGAMYNIIYLNTLFIEPEDFVYNIEPSEVGSKKIAEAIYLTR